MLQTNRDLLNTDILVKSTEMKDLSKALGSGLIDRLLDFELASGKVRLDVPAKPYDNVEWAI